MPSQTGNLTWDQAMTALHSGKRIAHFSFSPNEWMAMVSLTYIRFEDDCECSLNDFMACRHHEQEGWYDNWRVVGDDPEAMEVAEMYRHIKIRRVKSKVFNFNSNGVI